MIWVVVVGLALCAIVGLIVVGALRANAAETTRAHGRLDNQERQLKALAGELGWVDDRAHTKMVTLPLPPLARRDDQK